MHTPSSSSIVITYTNALSLDLLLCLWFYLILLWLSECVCVHVCFNQHYTRYNEHRMSVKVKSAIYRMPVLPLHELSVWYSTTDMGILYWDAGWMRTTTITTTEARKKNRCGQNEIVYRVSVSCVCVCVYFSQNYVSQMKMAHTSIFHTHHSLVSCIRERYTNTHARLCQYTYNVRRAIQFSST